VASPGVRGWGAKLRESGLGAKPPEADKRVINFVLRITLVNAYCRGSTTGLAPDEESSFGIAARL